MSSINIHWPNPRLEKATIIGHTTATSVRLWVRGSHGGEYGLGIGDRPNFFRSISLSHFHPIAQFTLTETTDFTHVVDLQELQPDTQYYYAIFSETENGQRSWELGDEIPLSFTTFPQQSDRCTFGFYSCHMPYVGNQLGSLECWEHFDRELTEAKARFVIGVGDQVYVDGNEDINLWEWLKQEKDNQPSPQEMIAGYRDIYQGYWGLEPVKKIFRKFANYMIWDDHEIKDGWGSLTESELETKLHRSWHLENPDNHISLAHEMFVAARQVYHEYQHSHNPPTDVKNHQFDYHFNYEFCAFYALDMRGHREFNRSELRILGEAQWQRFEAWLDREYTSDRRVLCIISPMPAVHLDNFVVNRLDIPYFEFTDDLRDKWNHQQHWAERNRLLDGLFTFSQETHRPVLFISGDVHLGAAFRLFNPQFPEANVFQLTSSPIIHATIRKFSRQILKVLVRERGELGDFSDRDPYQFENLYLCRQNNFGLVKIEEEDNGKLSIIYDLFNESSQEEGVIEKKRLKIQ